MGTYPIEMIRYIGEVAEALKGLEASSYTGALSETYIEEIYFAYEGETLRVGLIANDSGGLDLIFRGEKKWN